MLYSDEQTKVENLRGTISKLNADICNYNDLKSQGKDFFKKLHDEKIRYSKLNDEYNRAILDFENRMRAKNDEINKVKRELGNTITLLTTSETKARDLMVNLEQSKNHLGKATTDNSKLAYDLKEENIRYGKLLEDNRKDRNILKIS